MNPGDEVAPMGAPVNYPAGYAPPAPSYGYGGRGPAAPGDVDRDRDHLPRGGGPGAVPPGRPPPHPYPQQRPHPHHHHRDGKASPRDGRSSPGFFASLASLFGRLGRAPSPAPGSSSTDDPSGSTAQDTSSLAPPPPPPQQHYHHPAPVPVPAPAPAARPPQQQQPAPRGASSSNGAGGGGGGGVSSPGSAASSSGGTDPGGPLFIERGNMDKARLEARLEGVRWRIHDDGGGGSQVGYEVRGGELHFSGRTPAESAGLLAVRCSPGHPFHWGYQEGVEVMACGDGQRYQLQLKAERGEEAPVYVCEFTAKAGAPHTQRLPFSAFSPTLEGRPLRDAEPLFPERIRELGFAPLPAGSGLRPFALQVQRVAPYASRVLRV
eukprot:tig00000455_g1030.t1